MAGTVLLLPMELFGFCGWADPNVKTPESAREPECAAIVFFVSALTKGPDTAGRLNCHCVS